MMRQGVTIQDILTRAVKSDTQPNVQQEEVLTAEPVPGPELESELEHDLESDYGFKWVVVHSSLLNESFVIVSDKQYFTDAITANPGKVIYFPQEIKVLRASKNPMLIHETKKTFGLGTWVIPVGKCPTGTGVYDYYFHSGWPKIDSLTQDGKNISLFIRTREQFEALGANNQLKGKALKDYKSGYYNFIYDLLEEKEEPPLDLVTCGMVNNCNLERYPFGSCKLFQHKLHPVKKIGAFLCTKENKWCIDNKKLL